MLFENPIEEGICHRCDQERKLWPCPYDLDVHNSPVDEAARCCDDCGRECAMDI